jgi:peptidoglycan/LPS O-acetylase OafA/YrhL
MACVLSAIQVRRDGLQDFVSWGAAMNQRSLAATYRPEIDGLRAIAVLAVIIFHFNEHLLPSGFLGVDVFFVISGFVITASLARHQESDWRPFLLGFYARRIKRLIPLLMTCILVTMLVGAFVISPGSDEFNATWTTGIAALFGVSNITLQAQQSDYFASSTALNPFTHTWSLGVEEQFYFLFPILVFASGFSRHRPGAGRNLGLALALLSLASLGGWIVMNGRDPGWTFYFFPVRFWELAAGALALLAWRSRSEALAGRGFPLPAPAFLVVALLGLLVLPRSFATWVTVAVVLVTALLLLQLTPGQRTQRLLGAGPLRYIGLISYALYLWHWSVISLSTWTVGIEARTVPFQLALILLLSVVSHHAIEKPLRVARWGCTPARALLYGLLLVLGTGLLLVLFGRPLRGRFFSGVDPGVARQWDRQVGLAGTTVNGENCHSGPGMSLDDFATSLRLCTTIRRPGDRQRLFVLGDSHALALMPLVQRLHQELPLQVTHFSRGGCPKPPSASGHESTGCWAFAQQAMAATLAAARPGDLVLIHNYFRSHFGAGADTRSMQIDGKGNKVTDPAAKVVYYHQALDQLAARLAARGVRLVIVAGKPRFMDLRLDPNLCVKQWFRPSLPKACDQRLVQTLATHRADNAAINGVLAAVAARHRNVQIFDPTTALCPDGLCRSHDLDGKPLYRDRDHLNELGVLMLDGDLRRLLQRD